MGRKKKTAYHDSFLPMSEDEVDITPSIDIHLSDYPDIVDYLNTHQPDPNDRSSVLAYNRRRRLAAIIEFARTQPYLNQSALVDYLAEEGIGCNQSQLSKDLISLDLCPYVDRHGIRRLGRKSKVLKYRLAERYVRVFSESVFDARLLGNNIILDTLPGCGQAVATIIEASMWPEVIAVFYGMSSVCIMTMNDGMAARVLPRVKEGIM